MNAQTPMTTPITPEGASLNSPMNATDLDKRIGQYVRLRDMIKQLKDKHEAELEPFKDTLEKLNGALLGHLNALNVESTKAASGTAYVTEKTSASLADKTAFWSFVVAMGEWDLLDYKANPVAVEDYMKTSGTPVPGVNFSKMKVVGVRRASATKK